MSTAPTQHKRVFASAVGLLVIWGIALWLYNALFFKFSLFFALTPVQLAWTLTAFHVAYVLHAVPAVMFHRKFGFKLGMLVGLSIFGVAAFLLYLAIVQHSTADFLCAVVVIGSCGAWLDTALNPLVAIAGTPDSAVQRLNLAHVFGGIGMYAGYFTAISVLGPDYQLSSGAGASATAQPYVLVGLGAILLAFLVEQISLPPFAAKGTGFAAKNVPGVCAELRVLLEDKTFLTAAAALFAYCVVLTILWTANYKYHHTEVPEHVVTLIQRGAFWLLAGRMAGTVLMRRFDPARMLVWCSGLCIVAIAATALAGGMTGWVCLLSCSFLIAITYPTVFGSALSRHWKRVALAAGVLAVAAGLGNAASSLLTCLALDAFGISPRLVILAALPFEAVVLMFAWRALRKTEVARAVPATA